MLIKTFKPFNFETIQRKTSEAFTLAEVLITIAVLGVVAVLTIPNLDYSPSSRETVTKVKKVYSALTDAYDRAQVTYGEIDTWFKDISESDYKTRSERIANRINSFLKVSKDCGFEDGCFSTKPLLKLDDTQSSNNYVETLKSNGTYMVTLPDGVSVGYYNMAIIVDVDGANKGKNKYGYDIFVFAIDLSQNTLSGYAWTENDLKEENLSPEGIPIGVDKCLGWGISCSGWIINYDNADYQKVQASGEKFTCIDNPSVVLDGVTNISCH